MFLTRFGRNEKFAQAQAKLIDDHEQILQEMKGRLAELEAENSALREVKIITSSAMAVCWMSPP